MLTRLDEWDFFVFKNMSDKLLISFLIRPNQNAPEKGKIAPP